MNLEITPYVRNLIWILFIGSGAILFFYYSLHRQPKHPPVPGRFAKTITGIVVLDSANGTGDIDKILVRDGPNLYLLHFPPHAASAVLGLAALNTVVTAEVEKAKFRPGTDREERFELRTIKSADGSRFLSVHDILPPPPAMGNPQTVEGASVEIELPFQGTVHSFVLDGRKIALPPHSSESLIPLLRNAKHIVVKGYEHAPGSGFVNISHKPVVQASSIIIDGTNYSLE